MIGMFRRLHAIGERKNLKFQRVCWHFKMFPTTWNAYIQINLGSTLRSVLKTVSPRNVVVKPRDSCECASWAIHDHSIAFSSPQKSID